MGLVVVGLGLLNIVLWFVLLLIFTGGGGDQLVLITTTLLTFAIGGLPASALCPRGRGYFHESS